MFPKAQHYVPQFYLRNFAQKCKKGVLIYSYDKTTQKSFRTNIKNIGQETGFYNFETDDGKKLSNETIFWDLEFKTQKAIQEICDAPNYLNMQMNIAILAQFCVVQELRTPIFRDNYEFMNQQLHELFPDNEYLFSPKSKDESTDFQGKFIIDASIEIASILIEMKWILVRNQTANPFWTSDNPICRYNPLKNPYKSTLGLKCQGIQLFFPLSPIYLLLICDPIGYKNESSEMEANLMNIDFYNNAQAIYSQRFLFSNNNNFSLATDIISESPKLANPKNPRIIVG